ncbi:GlsB/YeaQ/YmgE family stress response membrane protein [Myceligenerans pegani]|uniref:GlsB/YeaQ/YmgE family stress response membrane protein n=1 Tax=Myceligenerans pegani TaxID=2776917 RepID=A0ABR9N2M7_9MICO|nr:GlsB/YeaQ/YmgE family stress response membrane protein [Myceligenerans sp. TRM 65318]MBE1877905.1 GlsB/YeaQ/YmgE family stress response membrane protein [Myceligenerans sp. TRM 65318]MBE3020176.1 GlsB/YeaQ/YmgE family stress response membrane protein [Myceligenerans sp. TRM 65318]
MGFIPFLILGLLAGVIARIILPGKQKGGFWLTLLLGVLGAMLGGWLGQLIFSIEMTQFWSWQAWLFSVIGALIVIGVFEMIFNRKKAD